MIAKVANRLILLGGGFKFFSIHLTPTIKFYFTFIARIVLFTRTPTSCDTDKISSKVLKKGKEKCWACWAIDGSSFRSVFAAFSNKPPTRIGVYINAKANPLCELFFWSITKTQRTWCLRWWYPSRDDLLQVDRNSKQIMVPSTYIFFFNKNYDKMAQSSYLLQLIKTFVILHSCVSTFLQVNLRLCSYLQV